MQRTALSTTVLTGTSELRGKCPKKGPLAKTWGELIVVEQRKQRRVLHKMLEDLGLRVVSTANLAEGLTAVNHRTVGLLVLVNGVSQELCAMLRAARTPELLGDRPIFVLVEGYISESTTRRLCQSGATSIIYWPADALMLPQLLIDELGFDSAVSTQSPERHSSSLGLDGPH